MKEDLIAPCGMNCAVCSGYLAFKNDVKSKGVKMVYCSGCRPRGKKCAFLKKRCDLLLNNQVRFCYECKDFPCPRLIHLDKRYKALFRMSFISNLEYIRDNGIQQFLIRETEKWKCPNCGKAISCHNGICFNCGLEKLKTKNHIYKWEDK